MIEQTVARKSVELTIITSESTIQSIMVQPLGPKNQLFEQSGPNNLSKTILENW
jgi:hypothetical protein